MRFLGHVCWLSLVVGCGDEFGVGGGTTSSSATATTAITASVSAPATSTSGAGPTASASTSSASTSGSGSSSTGVPVCDADGDGALVEAAGCCIDPAACDCDDTDGDVFPGQPAFFSAPRRSAPEPSLAYDYDCDGVILEQYPFASNPCGMLGVCTVSGLSFHGDMGEYECGVPGVLTECGLLGTCNTDAHVLHCR